MELTNSKPSSKRLLFDRRYGWVFDEWRDPSEEALAGGRGMFCIVPLAKAFFKTASNSAIFDATMKRTSEIKELESLVEMILDAFMCLYISFAASSVVKVLEKPDMISPEELQANLLDQLKRVTNSIQKP